MGQIYPQKDAFVYFITGRKKQTKVYMVTHKWLELDMSECGIPGRQVN